MILLEASDELLSVEELLPGKSCFERGSSLILGGEVDDLVDTSSCWDGERDEEGGGGRRRGPGRVDRDVGFIEVDDESTNELPSRFSFLSSDEETFLRVEESDPVLSGMDDDVLEDERKDELSKEARDEEEGSWASKEGGFERDILPSSR